MVVAGVLAQQRNRVWGSDVALWEDAVSHAPRKYRPQSQLAFAYFKDGRCADSVRHYEIASRLGPADYRLYYNWGLAYTCLGRTQDARRQYLAALEDCRRQLNRDPHNHAARQIVSLAEERLGLR
jgi:Tfp pilus assembly protein PilF